jgi:hypothetical protein
MSADEKRESLGKWREQLKKPGIKARKVGEKARRGLARLQTNWGAAGRDFIF